MGWGTTFKPTIYISRYAFENISDLDDSIDEVENDINNYKAIIKGYVYSTPKDIIPEEFKEEPVEWLNNKIDSLFNDLIDLYNLLHKLKILKYHLEDSKDNIAKYNPFKENTEELSTFDKISLITSSLDNLLQEKNKRYGDSALEPLEGIKYTAEDGIKIRLADKIKRVINSDDLRKNDVVDILGYLTLLCANKNWLNFEDLID
jgi:hypothetical protein